MSLLTDFPPELLCLIFERLVRSTWRGHQLDCLIRLAHVCKQWREIVLGVQSLWKPVQLYCTYPNSNRDVIPFPFRRLITSIHVGQWAGVNCTGGYKHTVYRGGVAKRTIALYAPRLQRLSFCMRHDEQHMRALWKMPIWSHNVLRKLTFENVFFPNDTFINWARCHSGTLTELSVINCSFEHIGDLRAITFCGCLRQLQLSICRAPILRKLVKSLSGTLLHLDLSKNKMASNSYIVIGGLKHLKSLILRDTHIQNEALCVIIDDLAGTLEVLSLESCSKLKGQHGLAYVKHLRMLTSLNLSFLIIGGSTLKQIVGALGEHLQQLTLPMCESVENEDFNCLLELHALQMLDIRQTYDIPKAVLAAIYANHPDTQFVSRWTHKQTKTGFPAHYVFGCTR